ncbi:MAG: nuclear transport factor 2 family protein [Brevundimonas sp.]
MSLLLAAIAALALQSQDPPPPPLAALVPPRDDAQLIAISRGAEAANATLDRMHAAAAAADGETYFAQFSTGARFIGTDAGEHWDIPAFRAYAEPFFARGQGWTYHPRDRTLIISGDFAWFDETLDHATYGVLRGSGLLRRHGVGDDWKIEQYVLSFAVPNDRADAVVALIRGE